MRLGHLGPAGTFTEEAARGSAAAVGGELVALATVPDAVQAVLAGDVEHALVPIENSLEGTVNQTVDALSADDALIISGEEVLAVRQCLIARTEVALNTIDEVLSHPQGHAQCARFLRRELPAARSVPAASTSEAVRALADLGPAAAAIGSRTAAEIHGATVLRAGIEDEPGNATRFVWLARAGSAPFPPSSPEAPFKTSVLFAGGDDETPGWLVRCLSELAFRGVNLVRIESRPARSGLGHYLFLIDCEGRDAEPRLAAAIEALARHCDRVRVLGSYAVAREDARSAPESPERQIH